MALAQTTDLCWLSPVLAVKVNHKHNQVNSGPIRIGGQREGVGQVAEKQDIAGLDTYPAHSDWSHTVLYGEEAASEGAQQDGASSARAPLDRLFC